MADVLENLKRHGIFIFTYLNEGRKLLKLRKKRSFLSHCQKNILLKKLQLEKCDVSFYISIQN